MRDAEDGFLRDATHLVHDRDPLYTKAWTALLEKASTACPSQHLRHLLREFCAHYHGERFQQALGGQLINPPASMGNDNLATAAIQCRSRLGGLLNYYHREAA